MDSNRLTLAGWLAIAGIALVVPAVAVAIAIGWSEPAPAGLHVIDALLVVAEAVIYVYVFLTLKRLLNDKARFHDTDPFILTLIGLELASAALGVLSDIVPPAAPVLGLLMLLPIIAWGVVGIIFGVKLLNCEDDLFGYLKPLAYTTITMNVALVTVILFPVAVIAGLVQFVFLAIIFFRAAKTAQMATETG